MPISSRLFRSVFVVVLVLPFSFAALGQQAGEIVILQGDVKEDSYLAGGSVYVRGRVTGDVVAAGGQVEIDNKVSADVLAAGGSVKILSAVGDDVRVVGGHVRIDAAVGGDAIAAGGNVTLTPSARVRGRAWLAGGEVGVFGKVGKGLRAAGGHIVIAGQVTGDVELAARSIEIEPGAVITGTLRYRSPTEAKIASGATIGGAVVREEMAVGRPGARAAGRVAGIGFSVGLVLAAIVLFLLFPVASIGAARVISDSPWKSLGIGFAVLVVTPLAIVLLCATLIGALLAFAALALYLVLLLVGFLTGAICLGDLGLRRFGGKRRQASKGWRVLSIVAAFVALAIIGWLPVLGGLACFAVLLFGLGGAALYLARRYRQAR